MRWGWLIGGLGLAGGVALGARALAESAGVQGLIGAGGADRPYTPLDLEAAARVAASENPSAGQQVWIEQIWTQIRQQKRGQSLYDRITGGTKQWGPQSGRRPVSTDKAASPLHFAVAERVLSGAEPSSLPGARKFFDPGQQDRVYAQVQKGKEILAAGGKVSPRTKQLIDLGYSKTAQEVRDGWASDGDRMVGTIGPVEFWT